MLGSLENGDAELALDLFDRIQATEMVDARILVSALVACVSLTKKRGKESCLIRGMKLHAMAAELGLISDVFLGSTLIDMYSSCERLDLAREVFETMKQRDSVAWNAMIQGCIDNRAGDLALELFRRMNSGGDRVRPDGSTFVAALTACAGLASREAGFRIGFDDEPGKMIKLRTLETGMEIHSRALESGFVSDFFVASSLVVMYAKCGSMEDARIIFDKIPIHDVVCWTALILGYAEIDEPELGLELFGCMQRVRGLSPSSRTLTTALVACAGLAAKEQAQELDRCFVKRSSLEKAMAIHAEAAELGFLSWDVFLASSLVDVYGKCGSLLDARVVFDRMPVHDTVAWTAMIQACGENAEHEAGLELFACTEARGLHPNARTCVAGLSSIAALAASECDAAAAEIQVDKHVLARDYLEKVMIIHSRCFDVDLIMENALIDAYSKCGSPIDARRVFDRMESHDVVSWNAIILGLVDNGQAELAVDLFAGLTQFASNPDARTFAAVLTACSNLAALGTGRSIHARLCRIGVESEPFLANVLVGFYSRCGCIDDAEELFCSIGDQKNTVAWSALLAGYGNRGDCGRVFGLLESMRDEGLQVDGVALLGALAACSHAGLVEKGRACFDAMVPKYGVMPEIKHYHCVIDMLGRANFVSEAVEMVKKMPYRPTGMTWTIVLAACRKWNDAEKGNAAFNELVKLEPENAAAYLMMANICMTAQVD